MHLCCCLLPKSHRDTMEVLFVFLKWVASFSHVDEETGSKMDLLNLATVISPNILYSKGKDPAKDESFSSVRAVHELLEFQDDFWQVRLRGGVMKVCSARLTERFLALFIGSCRVRLYPQRSRLVQQPLATHVQGDPRSRREPRPRSRKGRLPTTVVPRSRRGPNASASRLQPSLERTRRTHWTRRRQPTRFSSWFDEPSRSTRAQRAADLLLNHHWTHHPRHSPPASSASFSLRKPPRFGSARSSTGSAVSPSATPASATTAAAATSLVRLPIIALACAPGRLPKSRGSIATSRRSSFKRPTCRRWSSMILALLASHHPMSYPHVSLASYYCSSCLLRGHGPCSTCTASLVTRVTSTVHRAFGSFPFSFSLIHV